MADKKRPAATKGRPKGVLSRIGAAADKIVRDNGMSEETKGWLGGNARSQPLRAINRAALAALDIPVIGLSLLGKGTEEIAKGADNLARKTGVADKLSWQGNKFLPGTAGMALLEAFPMANPEGAELAASNALNKGRVAARPALRGAKAAVKAVAEDPIAAATKITKATGKTVKEIAKDTRGEFTPHRAPKKGVLRANHYSDRPDLKATDPSKWGTNKRGNFIPPEERRRIGSAPGRTYFGLQEGEGVTRPYSKESGVGPYQYTANLDRERLYDMDADPDGLRQKGAALPKDEAGRYIYGDKSLNGDTLYEQLIKDSGYSGYRTKNDSLGDVAVSYDPVNLERVEKPLEGAPTATRIDGERVPFGPYDPLRNSARRYAEDAGLDYTPPTRYAPQDPDFGARVAKAYDDMRHDPADPDVAEAYQALKNEMLAQYQRLSEDGYQFSFQDPNADPYPNPWQAIQDLRDNKRMQVYPTSAGFGSGAKLSAEDIANNPLLETVPDLKWRGPGGASYPVTYNDVFRANHDAYGHAKEGFGFRADGENAAYLQHLPTLSPAAQRALASETLGQNSWLNYGPYGEANRTAKVGETVFADQKNGLLPDELIFGGQAADFMPDPRGTSYGYRGDIPTKDGGTTQGRIRNDQGAEQLINERLDNMKQDHRKWDMENPSTIATGAATDADFRYPVSYSKLRNGTRREDLDIKVDDLPMADRKVISPEDLYGSTLIAGMADRTRAGGVLRQINDRKYWNPVRLEGGQDYMREHAGTGTLWASDKSPVQGVLRAAKAAEGDVYYAPFTMGGAAGDYSTMMSDLIASDVGVMGKASKLELLDHIGELTGTNPLLLQNSDRLQQLLRERPALRVRLAKDLDTAKWRDKGGPNIGALRQAITEPKLADVPNETFGYSLGKIDKTGEPIMDPANPHTTYRAQLPGEYAGGFEVMVPPNLMFPDVYEKAMASPRGRQDLSYMLKRGVPIQKADQKWLDGIMPYYEQAKERGTLDGLLPNSVGSLHW